MSRKKLTVEFIRSEFEKEGYDLLTSEYVDNRQKLNYVCPNDHKYNISWSSWRQGRRCYYCGISKVASERRENIEFIRAEFEREGYKLLTDRYENSSQKLEYICPRSHKHSISWSAWKNGGQRCSPCYGNVRLTIEYVGEQFEKEGYELLSRKYVNNKQKLKYRCSKGHEHSICFNNWQNGYRCYYCFGNVSPTIEFIKEEVMKENYEMASVFYVNNRQLLEYICSNGHKYKATWDSWRQGRRCWKCYCIRASTNKLGAKNWNWKGGISCEPYCDVWADEEYKDDIKARDNYECQNPDCWKTYKRLCLHHIDYGKKNCSPSNLITLCISCNGRANKDREWHTDYYTEIMTKRGLANAVQFNS